ncbi:DnaJ domain-containing protein, putative [Eimeria tenella]|uniref:DnaJ domain-containing protein, putative n=1 Tax=Eimeria tenella TaxID=5802 RepID=U6KKV8_EIMTE|nr:DnaJ domain-containing protein, putative [Eimeria tenella]CDJ37441.1 DnaJ domain-containing protein, putative [Eimeria tenella]|eukprot:XP_013228279.1 DnaJ domain-containing protein, putative [Eimeria tenella]
MRDIQNMQIEYRNKLEKEKSQNGLVILRALYGNLRIRSSFLAQQQIGVVEEQHLEGPYIDVTIPLQLSAGDVSLYVLYTFRFAFDLF